MPNPGRAQSGLSGAEFAGVGLQFAAVILVFTALGVWLDRRLGSSPLFMILCVFVGAAGGFLSIYRKAVAAQRRDAEQRKRSTGGTGGTGSGGRRSDNG
jgi:F0F1-type ATP synthase assembly protein I